jgi:transposase
MTRQGLSAREVAIRIGVDQRTVERWVAQARTAA